jgi:hypothetical protein
MESVTYLEVVDRSGRVRQRVVVAPRTTLLVGRAYDNDVIVDDPYVSEHHVRVDAGADGALVAHDIGSLNGLVLDGHGQVESARLGADDAVRMGESWLRVRRSDDPVAPTRLLAAGPWPLGWLERPWVAALALVLIPLEAAVSQLYASSIRWEPGDALGSMLESASLLVGWAVAWALVTRVARHEWHLLTHLAVAVLASAALEVVGIAEDVVVFLTDSPVPWAVLRLAEVVVIAWALRLHLALATTLEPAQGRAAATGAAGTGGRGLRAARVPGRAAVHDGRVLRGHAAAAAGGVAAGGRGGRVPGGDGAGAGAGGCGRSAGVGAGVFEPAELPVERFAGDAEAAGGRGLGGRVPHAVAQDGQLDAAQDVLERLAALVGGGGADAGGEGVDVDGDGLRMGEDEPMHLVLELADVAAPRVGAQGGEGLGCQRAELAAFLLLEAREEVEGERRHVVGTVTQRRDRDRKHAQAVEQIAPEAADGDLVLEPPVGGGDDAGTAALRAIRPDRLHLAVLQDAEQLRLETGRGVADLVEEHGAVAGVQEQPGAVAVGAGEGTAHVAEELGFEQRFRQGSAVLDAKRGARVGAEGVDGAGDDLLARARFTLDQHGDAGARGARSMANHLPHLGTHRDDRRVRELGG